MAEPVHFYWDRRRTRRGTALMSVIGLLGLPLLFYDGIDTQLLGLFWFAMFVVLASAIYRRGGRSEPVLTISDLGLHDRRISFRPLAWESISRIGGFDMEGVPFLGIDFHNPSDALSGARPLVRYLAPLHRLLRFPSASLNTSLLDANDADVIAAVKKFHPELIVSA